MAAIHARLPIAAEAAERGAAGAAATAAAVAAATAAAEAAAFEDGNPNYGDGQEKVDAVIADLLLIQELDKNPRVPKDELYRYNVFPEELTALGPRVRELGGDLYEALGLSSMDRRSFVQMKLKHQAHHPIARALLEKIKKNMEKLETIPLEMQRIKDRPVIQLKGYLFKEPELLPKPKDPKKQKVKR